MRKWAHRVSSAFCDVLVSFSEWCCHRRGNLEPHTSAFRSSRDVRWEDIDLGAISRDVPRLSLSTGKIPDRSRSSIDLSDDIRRANLQAFLIAVADMAHEGPDVAAACQSTQSFDVHSWLLESLRQLGSLRHVQPRHLWTTVAVLYCCTQSVMFPFVDNVHTLLQRHWAPDWEDVELHTSISRSEEENGVSETMQVAHRFVTRNHSRRLLCGGYAVPLIDVEWEVAARVMVPLARGSRSSTTGIRVDIEMQVLRCCSREPSDEAVQLKWWVTALRWLFAPLASARFRDLSQKVMRVASLQSSEIPVSFGA